MRHRRFDLPGSSTVPTRRADPPAIRPEAFVEAETRLALVMGNGRYRDMPLANPIRDAEDIAWGLEGLGFSVRLLKDAALAPMQEALVAFADAVDEAGPEAVAVVYYAGHGVQMEGTNFLIPVSAEITAARHLATRALPLETLARELGRRSRKATVIVLDACRDRLVGDESQDVSATQGMVRSRLPRPTQLVYSTAAMASAQDGWGGHSPFALALMEEMPSLLVPGTRIQDVFDTVAAKVSLWTGEAQTVAVYREGVLPPLTLTAEDEARRQAWSRRPYRMGRRQVARRAAAAAALLALLTAAVLWISAYPETRTGLMLRAGLLDKAQYDFTCAPPWDETSDRYGLTRRDWCLSLSNNAILERVTAAGLWQRAVEPGFAEGDPKAVALKAMAADEQGRAPGHDEAARARLLAEAGGLARRAAATDLPRGRLLCWMLGGRLATLDFNLGALLADLDMAGARGVLLAKLLRQSTARNVAGITGSAHGADPTAGVEAALVEADALDPSGETAYGAAQLYRSGSAFTGGAVQIPRYRAWLRRAARAGVPAAAAEWLVRAQSDPDLRLSASERRDLMAVAAKADDPPGLYWQAMLRVERDGLDAAAALGAEPTATLFRRSAEAGYPDAIQLFIEAALRPGAGRSPDMAEAVTWLRRAVAAGNRRAAERLATLLAYGAHGSDGAVLVSPDPAAARDLVERPEWRDEPWALDLLADLLRYGPIPGRDPARAFALWRFIEQRMPDPRVALRARTELDRAWTETSLAQGAAADHAFASGAADAPVTVTAFVAADCLGCRRFLYDVLRPTIAVFAPAKVRFEVRPVWRDDDPGALEAALVAACAARPEDRFRLFVALTNAQADWVHLTTTPERLAAFGRAIAGLSGAPDDPARCLADEAARVSLTRQRDAVRALPIAVTPMVFVGGAAGDTEQAEPLRKLIASQLPP